MVTNNNISYRVLVLNILSLMVTNKDSIKYRDTKGNKGIFKVL